MDVKKIVSEMTLEEKAKLVQGVGFWHTCGVERLGVPAMMLSDGPHGLRKQDMQSDHLGINDSIKAVCFPTAVGTACSFDRELMGTLGKTLGQACQAQDLGVILGPAVNIKRSPLCGRNFEYVSEDPFLAGEMSAAYISGVQSENVGVSLKHFAVNNQETRRMSVDEHVSERALREIYFTPFEKAVKQSKPWTLMCSYNKINGTYSSENKWLLTDVLRKEWGFEGLVMTDWGASNDRVKGVASGLDLEMPESGESNTQKLVDAVKNGQLAEGALNACCENVLTMVDKYATGHRTGEEYDLSAQHHMARRIARESMVLLKNEGDILPIHGNKKVAFIGKFADKPRFMGGGSSHINVSEVTSALQAVRSVCPVTYAQGYNVEEDQTDDALLHEAVETAKAADIAVLFVGLPDAFESEGYDRSHMDMPSCQLTLIDEIAKVQKNIVIVLHNGSPVTLPFADKASAILEAYLGGQACGGAVVDLLFGAASPCGKLAETFPLRLEDTPCYLDFPGDGDRVNYTEGVYVGYRYYDKRKTDVRFPFGFGLTYTTFAYSNLRLSADSFDGSPIKVEVDVTNTGKTAAKEIVEFYVRPDHAGHSRPVRELKGFDKVSLAPGETKTAACLLDSRSFAYWEEEIHDWYVEPGLYQIEAAASSRDIRLTAPVNAITKARPIVVTADTTFGDIMTIPGARDMVNGMLSASDMFGGSSAGQESAESAVSASMMEAMLKYLPLHGIMSFGGGSVTPEMVDGLIKQFNDMQK